MTRNNEKRIEELKKAVYYNMATPEQLKEYGELIDLGIIDANKDSDFSGDGSGKIFKATGFTKKNEEMKSKLMNTLPKSEKPLYINLDELLNESEEKTKKEVEEEIVKSPKTLSEVLMEKAKEKIYNDMHNDLQDIKSKVDVKNRLRVILATEGINQTELCKVLDISRSTLSNIINGYQNPTISTALDLAHYLRRKVEDIFYKDYSNSEIAKREHFYELLDRINSVRAITKHNAISVEQEKRIYKEFFDEYLMLYEKKELEKFLYENIRNFADNDSIIDVCNEINLLQY